MSASNAETAIDFESRLEGTLKAYRERLPAIMAGLADRPKSGTKELARKALVEHMQGMQELARAYERLNPKALLGSGDHASSDGVN